MNLDALLLEDLEDLRGDILVLPAEQLVAPVHDRDPGAEATEHLPEFQPDVAAANHQQMFGDVSQFHDRGGVEMGNLLDTLQSRNGGTSAGVDDDGLSFDLYFALAFLNATRRADLEGLGAGEAGRAHDQLEVLLPLDSRFGSAAETVHDIPFPLPNLL